MITIPTARADSSKLLTIVIPVYNLESYIETAVQSVLKQRHIEDVAIIVIDDGSTDGSRARIDEMIRARPDVDIRVLSQRNAGLSAARNKGVELTRSPYVAFLDGDDAWEPDFLQTVVPILRAGRADIVEYNLWIVGFNGRQSDELTLIHAEQAGEHLVDEALLLNLANTYQLFVPIRIYRTSLFDGIAFPIGQTYEDAAVMPRIYLRAQITHRLQDRLYNYYRRAGSISQVVSTRSVRDLAKNVENAILQCADHQHGHYWMTIAGKAFAHTCRETARVDDSGFHDACEVVREIVRKCRLLAVTHPSLSRYVPYEHYMRAIYKERLIFVVKQRIRRLLGQVRRF